MKRIIGLLLTGVFVFIVNIVVFAQDEVLEGVKVNFKQGNARDMARYLGDIVEISVDGEKGSYSKTQAEFVLKNFFQKNPPADFKKVHQGASKEGLTYLIGKYYCPRGTYRVYIVVKQFKGSYLVDAIDFSKE